MKVKTKILPVFMLLATLLKPESKSMSAAQEQKLYVNTSPTHYVIEKSELNKEEQTTRIKHEIEEFNHKLQVPEKEILYQLEIFQPPQSTSEILKPQYQEKGSLPNEGVVNLIGTYTEILKESPTPTGIIDVTVSFREKLQVKKIDANQKINWKEGKEIFQGLGSSPSEAIVTALRRASEITMENTSVRTIEENKDQTSWIINPKIEGYCSSIEKFNSYFNYKVIEEEQKDGNYQVKLEIVRGIEINP